jgi:Chlorophyll A-B binding protein
MQERELLNGRAAMLAVAAFVWEELVTGRPVIEIESNALLFQPLYQVPIVQTFLDAQFSR